MSLLVTTLAYSARAHADLGELAEARKDAGTVPGHRAGSSTISSNGCLPTWPKVG